MKLWVVGSSGQVARLVGQKGDFVTSRQEADITNLDSLLQFAKQHPSITHIINCAGFSAVDRAEVEQKEAFDINAKGAENLSIAASEIKARLLHLSTDYVFSGDKKSPWKETDPTLPCNYYGYTKLEGEKRVQKMLPSACILRTSWIFGDGGTNFVTKLFTQLQDNETVQLTHDQWGKATYAPDLCSILYQLLHCSGIYQFANQDALTKYEFGLAMHREALALGIPMKVKNIIPVPSSIFSSLAKRPIYSALDTTKIEKELKISIRSWKESLKEFLCSRSALLIRSS